MNLLDYLPKGTIETARVVAMTNPIRIFAPEDQTDLARKADASIGFRMNFFAGNRRSPTLRDLHELKANAEFIRGGPKVIRPSPQACRMMARIELNLTLDYYAQPYESTGVVIPKSVTGLPKDVLSISHWEPGLGIFVGTHIGPQYIYQTIGPHWPNTLEDHLGVIDRFDEGLTIEDPHALSRLFSRIALNACLFAVERAVRVLPLDPQAEKRRARAGCDERMARLAARDAQEVLIQDLDLILMGRSGGEPGEPTGRHLRPHRRRGHWKMQPHGLGRSQRKRILVASYLVNADGPEVPEITTLLT